MAKRKKSEETTKGLVASQLSKLDDYPLVQNVCVNGVMWFKEDSYHGTNYDWLADAFRTASKKQTMRSKGTPDFVVVWNGADIIVVIECKGSVENHIEFQDPNEYRIRGYGAAAATEKYAVNGALWYASFLKDEYDVVAIGVSGQSTQECLLTSLVWPKHGALADLTVLENGYFSDFFCSIRQYKTIVDSLLGRTTAAQEQVRKQLRRYTLECANFLRQNGIEDNSKAGFVSAIILGLTNKESILYKNIKNAIVQKQLTKAKTLIVDPIGRSAVSQLKQALYGDGNNPYDPAYIKGVWDKDEIPQGKRVSLCKFYDALLAKSELLQAPKGKSSHFPDGDTVLSCCLYSLFENVVQVIDNYAEIDVMGEFYTTFLRFTKGNAKEKGIVLTPKHITELFCDIAEYYSGQRFTEKTKIIDICCGTGAFLITALSRIKHNLSNAAIKENLKADRLEYAQKHSLIGVERDASMYALAYANMRFHGDGKSNLFNCSSLLIDSYAPVDDAGTTYMGEQRAPLSDVLKSFGDIDIGMINPPYSLNTHEANPSQTYQFEKDFEDKKKLLKALNKKCAEARKQNGVDELREIERKISICQTQIEKLGEELSSEEIREILLQKGQSELDFVASMLHYLKKGGIGIAIVPMSCAGSSGKKLRSELLKHHTLLACMTMPQQLFFDSHIGQATCIMVFKAHIPHDESKTTFFGRWIDDGYRVIPHNGRKDADKKWNSIRKLWLSQLDGATDEDKTVWTRGKLLHTGEALPEAYVKTSFSQINDVLFCGVIRKYCLYKFMESRSALDIKDSAKLNWLLDNYSQFEAEYSPTCKSNSVKLTERTWAEFRLGDILDTIENGKSYNASDLTVSDTEDYLLYITRTDNNNGVSMCVSDMGQDGIEAENAITVGDTTATIFFQGKRFITGPHMIVLRAPWLNVYNAHFLIAIISLERYRYPVFGRPFLKESIRSTEIKLPVNQLTNEPDYDFMCEYIKSLPFSSKLGS